MILGTENFKSFSQKHLRKNVPGGGEFVVCHGQRPVSCERRLHCSDGGTGGGGGGGDDCFIIVIDIIYINIMKQSLAPSCTQALR